MLFKSIVHVNTDVVTQHWVLKQFKEEKLGTKSKVLVFMGQNAEPVSVFKDSCDHLVNHTPDCCCLCWNVMSSNCCTNFSDLMFPTPSFIVFVDNEILWGGSVCLSWLLEPSLSNSKGTHILPFVLSRLWKWFAGTATPKRCVLLYISYIFLHCFFFFFFFYFILFWGDLFLLCLTGWSRFSLTAFWK